MFSSEYFIHPKLEEALFGDGDTSGEAWEQLCGNPTAVTLLEYFLRTRLRETLNNISWFMLAKNETAEHIVKEHMMYVPLRYIAGQKYASDLIKANVGQHPLGAHYLLLNPNIGELLHDDNIIAHLKTITKPDIMHRILALNPHAVDYLVEQVFTVNGKLFDTFDPYWANLFSNPNAVHLFEPLLSRLRANAQRTLNPTSRAIDWVTYRDCLACLCMNPSMEATPHVLRYWDDMEDYHGILLQHSHDEVVIAKAFDSLATSVSFESKCHQLSHNPKGVHLIPEPRKRWHAIWVSLSKHGEASVLLQENMDKIVWHMATANPRLNEFGFKLNNNKMRQKCMPFAEELAKYVFHPKRLMRLCQAHAIDLADYFDLTN